MVNNGGVPIYICTNGGCTRICEYFEGGIKYVRIFLRVVYNDILYKIWLSLFVFMKILGFPCVFQ